jgi:hypothetical protein
MRLTRAALRAEATETPDASSLQTERVPLGEVSVNAVSDISEQELDVKNMAPAKKTKAKAAKKGAKGKKGKKIEDDTRKEEEQQQVVLEDEREAAASPASDAAVEELIKPPTEGSCSSIHPSPSHNATRNAS